MGKIYTLKINSFNGGISNDIRSKDLRYFAFASHLDSFTYPHKLVPRFGADTEEAGAIFTTLTAKPYKFLYADGGAGADASTYLYGLGEISGGRPSIIRYDTDTSVWESQNGNVGDVGTGVDKDVFFHYKGYAYMWDAGTLMDINLTLLKLGLIVSRQFHLQQQYLDVLNLFTSH